MRLLVLPLICLSACEPTAAIHSSDTQAVQTRAAGSVLPADRPSHAVETEANRAPAAVRPLGETGERGRFVAMSGALTLTIETDEGPLEVRLAEVDTPLPDEAQAWLADRVAGHDVELVYSGSRRDRYDRALAHVIQVQRPESDVSTVGVDWLQYHLVEAGLARVMSHADNHSQAAVLLPVEAQARRQGRGMWSDPAHQVRDPHPDARAQDIGTVQVVEGRVLEAVQLNSGRIYLNFGSDYRNDFTVRVDASDGQAFLDAGLGPDDLTGRRVRVRGWLTDENGPMIVIDHPARLELLDEDPSASQPR